MSKSRGNVVDPDAYIDRVGADNLRMYMLFCGDWQEGAEFSDRDLQGVVRFSRRLWDLLTSDLPEGAGDVDMAPLDRTIAAVETEIDRFKFNTAIAHLMEVSRWATEQRPRMSADQWRRTRETVTLLLAPLAPHMAEEAWERLGGAYSVHEQRWPNADSAALRASEVTLVIQVNGRVRGRSTVPAGLDRDEALRLALHLDSVRRHVSGAPKEVFYVPDRLLNIVV
jgi:leucyl-tRNA synthetase